MKILISNLVYFATCGVTNLIKYFRQTPGSACSYTTTSTSWFPQSCDSNLNDAPCSYEPMLGYVLFSYNYYNRFRTYMIVMEIVPDQGSNLDFSFFWM